MELQELKEVEMYCLVAPDGNPQLMSLAYEFEQSCGVVEMLAKKGISDPLGELFAKGFTILPVKITIVQNGTEEEGFQRAKNKLKGK